MNPFASRFIRPDNNVYRFDRDGVIDNERRAAFVGKLLSALRTRRCAAIVGPHGTGKTTLLRSIESDLRAEFDHVSWSTLTTDKRYSHRELLTNLSPNGTNCLVVDGYEQLRWWHRLALIHSVKQRSSTVLIVTCHQRSQWIPTCLETRWDESMSRFLTEEKLQQLPDVMRNRIWAGYENRLKDANPTSQNLRELWFSMYDEYEIAKVQERLHQEK